MADSKVVIKKVAAYPIASKLVSVSSGNEIVGQIVRLTQSGFIIEVENLAVKVGKEYEVQFQIPASDRLITEKVKVVKVYDRYKQQAELKLSVEKNQAKLYRLAEMHFLSIGTEEKKWIRDFILHIRQAPDKPR